MIGTYLIFLVLLIPNTERPTMVLMKHFDTATECNKVLEGAPPESKSRFACIKIDLAPTNEGREV